MSYYNALLLSYILILTFGYFVTFLLYYIFGWYYDKRLRLVMKRIHLSRFQSFFLRFRGVPRNSTDIHTAVCTYCEIFSIFSLIGAEGISLLLVKLAKINLIQACRFSLLFMFMAIIGWTVMAFAISREFKKRIDVVRKQGRVKFRRYKDLDNIVLGMDNLSAWAPENMESKPLKATDPFWEQYVVDFESLTSIRDGKSSVKVKTPTGGFYHPIVENENVDSLGEGKQKISSTNILADDKFIPVNIEKNGSEAEDMLTGFSEVKGHSPLDDDIFMPVVPLDLDKFGGSYDPQTDIDEKSTDIEHGKKAMQDMAKKQLYSESGHTNFDKILKDKNQVSEKSVKDLIKEHKKDIDPANKLNGNFPM